MLGEASVFTLHFTAVKIILPADSCYGRATNRGAMMVLNSLEPLLYFVSQ